MKQQKMQEAKNNALAWFLAQPQENQYQSSDLHEYLSYISASKRGNQAQMITEDGQSGTELASVLFSLLLHGLSSNSFKWLYI